MFKRKIIDRAAWEAAVIDNPHHRPIPDELLRETTRQIVTNDVRIILESVDLVMTTRYADTREHRRDLAEQWYAHLQSLKPFMDKEQLKMAQAADEAMKKLSLFCAVKGWDEDDEDDDDDEEEYEDDGEEEVPATPSQLAMLNTITAQLRSIHKQLQDLENEMSGDNSYSISDAASAVEDALDCISDINGASK